MWRNILQEITENAPPPRATEDVPNGFALGSRMKLILTMPVYC